MYLHVFLVRSSFENIIYENSPSKFHFGNQQQVRRIIVQHFLHVHLRLPIDNMQQQHGIFNFRFVSALHGITAAVMGCVIVRSVDWDVIYAR